MKCEHYGINPNHSLSDEICLCNGDTPSPGWRDVREETANEIKELIHADMIKLSFSGMSHKISGHMRAGIIINEYIKNLPAPPEGVQR
jgi:hypothetical protein